MTFEEIASIGELIGGIGVLATLIFLTLEVRKNSRIMRANAKTAGMESLATYNEILATDPFLSSLFDRVLTGENFDALDSVERFRLTMSIRALIQRMEAQYFQYEEGMIDAIYWEQRLKWLSSFLDISPIATWWEIEAKSAIFTEEFVAHINARKKSFSMGGAGQFQDGH